MAIDSQIPAQVYEAIATGVRERRAYEVQSGVPVDGSDPISRDPTFGSPFTVRLLPPDILLESLTQEDSAVSVTIMDSAMQVNDGFASYERRIQAFQSAPLYAQGTAGAAYPLIGANGVRFDPYTGKTSLANDLALADLRQAESAIAQMQAMVNTPPLTLLVNPQSMTVTRAKKQQYSDRSRYGLILDAWGEEQVRVSFTGKTGAWFAGTRFTDSDAPQNFNGIGAESRGRVSTTSSGSGVSYFNKNDSAAWQNFQQLRLFYQNNGYIFDLPGETEAHLWVGAVALDYDQWTYVGNFDSFSFGETEATTNGGVEFSVEFTANFVYDHGQREFQVLPIQSPTPSPSDALWSTGIGPVRTPSQDVGPNLSNYPSSGSLDPLRQALIRSKS